MSGIDTESGTDPSRETVFNPSSVYITGSANR